MVARHLRGGSDPLAVTVKPTAPIDGQKPGTSGVCFLADLILCLSSSFVTRSS